MTNPSHLFQNIEKEEWLPYLLYKVSGPPMQKSERLSQGKNNYRPVCVI